MQVTVFAPSARLAPFVRRFTVVETTAEATRALLPERGLVLGVRFGGAAALLDGAAARPLSSTSLTGMQRAARRMRTSAGGGIVLAAFRETGAARFFAVPLHELFGRTLALGDLVPRDELDRVQSQIVAAASHVARVAILEQFLLARLLPDEPDPIAIAAVSAIQRAHGSIRIAALARQLGISQDPLEKRFRRAVGTSPKQLASLVRLMHVIEGQRSGASWSRLAVAAGYFDQSHFIREFRGITGESPERFFRTGSFC